MPLPAAVEVPLNARYGLAVAVKANEIVWPVRPSRPPFHGWCRDFGHERIMDRFRQKDQRP